MARAPLPSGSPQRFTTADEIIIGPTCGRIGSPLLSWGYPKNQSAGRNLLRAKPIRSTVDTKEGYTTNTGYTSSVNLTPSFAASKFSHASHVD